MANQISIVNFNWIEQAEEPRIAVMEQIKLPLAKIEHQNGEVKITSTLTGTVATMSAKQLQNWAVAQLRKELITPKAETR